MQLRITFPLALLMFWSATLTLPAQQPSGDGPKESQQSEPTRITGPKADDGTIDYLRAINERYGKGVTAQNNSVVAFWQAIGLPPRTKMPPKEYFDLLGTQAPAKEGEYFISSVDYFRGKGFNDEQMDKIFDQEIETQTHPWRATDFPDIAEWLKANERPLELVAEAVKRERFYSPLVVPEKQPRNITQVVFFPLPGVIRDLTHILISRAMLHVGEGNRELAWKDLLTCFRISRQLGQGMNLTERLIAYGNEGATISACLRFIQHTQPTSAEIAGYQRELAELRPIQLSDYIDYCERCEMLELAQRFSHGDFKDFGREVTNVNTLSKLTMKRVSIFADWDVVYKELDEWFDQLLAAMNETHFETRQRRLEEIESDIDEDGEKLFKQLLTVQKDQTELAGKIVAEVIIALNFPTVSFCGEMTAFSVQMHRSLRIAFALASYHSDNRRYPAELSELKPKYLATIPGDIYSGKEMHYRLTDTGYLLYSVGKNRQDDQGNNSVVEPSGDDVGVRMPAG